MCRQHRGGCKRKEGGRVRGIENEREEVRKEGRKKERKKGWSKDKIRT